MTTMLFMLFSALGVLVGSIIGFAGALVAIPFITLVLAPQTAVPAYSLLTLVMNLVIVIEARRHLELKGLTALMLAGVGGTLVGAWSLAHLPAGTFGPW